MTTSFAADYFTCFVALITIVIIAIAFYAHFDTLL
jgi:hypothetical protein